MTYDIEKTFGSMSRSDQVICSEAISSPIDFGKQSPTPDVSQAAGIYYLIAQFSHLVRGYVNQSKVKQTTVL